MHKVETYLRVNDNGEIVIKQEHLSKLQELRETKEKVERELKTLSSSIVSELKEHYQETTKISDYNFVVKGGNYGFEFDLEKFKNENFELYLSYLKPTQTSVSFSLVSAKRKKGVNE